jgi:DNA-binding transcriptional ArsR family regulator
MAEADRSVAGQGPPPVAGDAVAGSDVPRDISDPHVMRALAHPVRIALMETLLRDGPLTATEAAAALDESPGNMSWHLQTLAKYGFVEETGDGKGRRRPWRLVSLGQRFAADSGGGPDLSTAAESLGAAYQIRAFERLKQFRGTQDSFGPDWVNASFTLDAIRYLTPDELRAVDEELVGILDRFRARTMHPAERPTGAMAIHVVAFAHPLPPTTAGN